MYNKALYELMKSLMYILNTSILNTFNLSLSMESNTKYLQ